MTAAAPLTRILLFAAALAAVFAVAFAIGRAVDPPDHRTHPAMPGMTMAP